MPLAILLTLSLLPALSSMQAAQAQVPPDLQNAPPASRSPTPSPAVPAASGTDLPKPPAPPAAPSAGADPGSLLPPVPGAGQASPTTPLSQTESGDCSQTPDVKADSQAEACSSTVAVNATGDARGADCAEPVGCVTASGTGSAQNTSRDCGTASAAKGQPVSVGCIAVTAGEGNASNSMTGSCGTGFGTKGAAVGVGCIAASGAGTASNTNTGPAESNCGVGSVDSQGAGAGIGCLAFSASGDALNTQSSSQYSGSHCGTGQADQLGAVGAGCIAASGAGTASNTNTGSISNCGVGSGKFGLQIPSGTGFGAGCIAASGTGPASNRNGVTGWSSCGEGSWGLGAFGAGCIAASGTGPATNQNGVNRWSSFCGEGSWGLGAFGAGCIAASGSGPAINENGSCGTSSSTGVSWVPGAALGAGCIAASGTGPATNTNENGSCGGGWAWGAALGAGCIAASGTGPATNQNGSCGNGSGVGVFGAGCIAASGSGEATNKNSACGKGSAGLGAGFGVGCIAASGSGPATNTNQIGSCGQGVSEGNGFGGFGMGVGFGAGCIAASGSGPATNQNGPCATGTGTGYIERPDVRLAGDPYIDAGLVVGLGVGLGCISASGDGHASNDNNAECGVGKSGVSGAGFGAGCISASATKAAGIAAEVSISDAGAFEGPSSPPNQLANQIVFQVRRTGDTTSPARNLATTFTYETIDGSAKANSDYWYTKRTVAIPAGSDEVEIRVDLIGDDGYGPDKYFTVKLTRPGGGVTFGDDEATGTIKNDDPEPTISLSPTAASFAESSHYATFATFTVTQSAQSEVDTRFKYGTQDISAEAGSDYRGVSDADDPLTIEAGSTTAEITVLLVPDQLYELDETFLVKLLPTPVNAGIGAGTATVTIKDDDPKPAISILDARKREGHSGTSQMVFTAKLSTLSGASTSARFSTADRNTVAGSDYTATSGSLTVRKGSLSGTVSVPVIGDNAYEAHETFLVNLSSLSGAVAGDTQAKGTIINDDPSLSVLDAKVAEGNSGVSNMSFVVKLSAASPVETRVTYYTADRSAIAGADYTAKTGILTIPAGALSATVRVSVNGDTVAEKNETFYLRLKSPVNASIADGTAFGTILNDDPPT